MGAASSNTGKYKNHDHSQTNSNHYVRGTSTAKGPPKSSWTQAHLVSSRPAAPSNLNLNRALATATRSNTTYRHPTVHQDHRVPLRSPVRATNKVERPAPNYSPVQPFFQSQIPNPKPNGNRSRRQNFSEIECTICGHTGHNPERCFHRDKSCYICNKPGHLASVCSDKVHAADSRYKMRKSY